MRPIANFTLHAILAAALAAFAATGAAASKFDAWLELGDIRGETEAHKDQRNQHIELLSYSFGASQVLGGRVVTVADAIKALEESRRRSDASAGRGASNEVSMDDTAGREKMQPGGGSASGVGVKRVFVKSWSTSGDAGRFPGRGVDIAAIDGQGASGQATGKRTHNPLRARMYYDEGSVTLAGRFPACRVGAAYPSAAIGHGTERYDMQDVTVTACSPEGMSLNFKKVTVRGWNPETKEL